MIFSPVEESINGFRKKRDSSSATFLASAKLGGCTMDRDFAILRPDSVIGKVAGESLSPGEKFNG